jgi:hypothetical protein
MWDELLQQEFSPTRGMFDVQPVSGTKIAVTTTVGRPMLLINYRRTSEIQSGKRAQALWTQRIVAEQDLGDYYHAHEAKNADEEPRLWQWFVRFHSQSLLGGQALIQLLVHEQPAQHRCSSQENDR